MAKAKTVAAAPQVQATQEAAPNELVASLKEENAALAAEIVRLKSILRFTTGKDDHD